MDTEYVLPFNGIEIEEKLGKIDSLATKNEVPTKTSQLNNDSGFITSYTETDPTVPAWAKASTKPTYTASEVGADASGTANSLISAHNTATDAHADIRTALNNKLSSSELQTAINTSLAQAKASGEFDGANGKDGSNGKDGVDGKDGVSATHSWNGTTLTITSASGTSSADLKGDKGDKGATGAAGTTPVKGTDYFTEADKAEMVEDVKNSIPGLGDLLGGGVEEVTYVPSLDGYLKVETGAIYTGTAGTYHTDYIALEGYAEILASCNISSQGYALAFFDSSKTLLPAISIVAEGSGVTKTINMEVPSEAAYCMLCDYEYAPPSNAFITLIPSRGIVERVDELDARTNPLNGKTIAVLGDSISSVAYTVPNYWQMIAEKTGCNFLDYGVSGSCFAVRSAEHTRSFLERAADMASADAVLVMGGTNDANKNILLGDWASTDNTTLYGSLNALIALLRSKYPGRPIVFCTPIKMKGDTDDGFPKTMADLKNATASTNLELWHCALAIQAKCAVHGIPVIDLYNASGIGSGLSGFFRPDDSLHPSILGECRIANMVQPVLEQQFLYTTKYFAEPVNLVPTSIDTDGSIFNGTGYKDGYRLSSSGNTSVQAGSTVTGFIEFITSDVLRIKGVTMTDSNAAGTYVNNSYIAFYDSAFTKIGVTNNAGGSGICPNAVNSYRTSETNGVHTYDFSAVDGTNVKYIRISSPFGEAGSGSGMFVTVNQEIT